MKDGGQQRGEYMDILDFITIQKHRIIFGFFVGISIGVLAWYLLKKPFYVTSVSLKDTTMEKVTKLNDLSSQPENIVRLGKVLNSFGAVDISELVKAQTADDLTKRVLHYSMEPYARVGVRMPGKFSEIVSVEKIHRTNLAGWENFNRFQIDKKNYELLETKRSKVDLQLKTRQQEREIIWAKLYARFSKDEIRSITSYVPNISIQRLASIAREREYINDSRITELTKQMSSIERSIEILELTKRKINSQLDAELSSILELEISGSIVDKKPQAFPLLGELKESSIVDLGPKLSRALILSTLFGVLLVIIGPIYKALSVSRMDFRFTSSRSTVESR